MLNHFEVEYDDNDLVQLILGVASGEIDDRQLLVWLQQHLV
jgi:prophage maintenance system killer protein